MDNTKRTTTSWTIQCIRHREHDSPYKQRVHSMACVPLAAHAAVLDALSECGRDGFAVFKTLSYCGRGGFASLPVGLGGTQEGDGRLGVAGRRWMGALRGAGPPPHRTDSSQTAATRPPTLGRSGQIAASLGLAAVNHISRREASLAARVAGSDAPARGGWRRPHGDRGGADGDGGRRKRQECEWEWPGAVAQNGRASRWSKPRARASGAGLGCGTVTAAAGG